MTSRAGQPIALALRTDADPVHGVLLDIAVLPDDAEETDASFEEFLEQVVMARVVPGARVQHGLLFELSHSWV